MIYRFAFLLVLASIIAGCAGSRGLKHETSAINAKEAVHPERYTLVYSLPKTTLRISVEASRFTTRRGPYYQYAERYLGITGVPERNYDRWVIDNISIDSYQEADPEHYYLLKTNDRYVTNFFRLEAEGFILPVNQKQLPDLDGYSLPGEVPVTYPLYTDLSIHPLVVEETRTVMRMVRQDTAFVNVPVLQRQSVTKSLEARAAEVADLIFELRSNRFKLISGDLDLFPDGKAMEAIIEEFRKQESEYLSLFTGKVSERKHRFVFDYTPPVREAGETVDPEALFRFSESDGVLSADETGGRPVIIELTYETKTGNLERVSTATRQDRQSSGIYYRVPEAASARISDGRNELASRRVLVSQMGRIIVLPADFLWE